MPIEDLLTTLKRLSDAYETSLPPPTQTARMARQLLLIAELAVSRGESDAPAKVRRARREVHAWLRWVEDETVVVRPLWLWESKNGSRHSAGWPRREELAELRRPESDLAETDRDDSP